MRVINSTSFKDTTAQDLLNDVGHFVKYQLKQYSKAHIESITIEDNRLMVFGEDCLLLETPLVSLRLYGVIRWFDELSGAGMIRLDNGESIRFFSCNVNGADSMYPELVSNIKLEAGQRVTGVLDSDSMIVRDLGLTSIEVIS